MSKPIYLIDPGHGGHDSGAVGTRIQEKQVVLDVSIRLRDILIEDGRVDVSLTRTSDLFLTLSDRADMANRMGATLLSIHANAGGGTGFEAFTSPGQTKSDPLATSLLASYADAFSSLLPGRYDYKDGDPDKEARFTVLTRTRGAAVLFELAFVDRESDQKLLENPDVRQKMAMALANGITQHEFDSPVRTIPEPPVIPEEPDTPEEPVDTGEEARLRAILFEAKEKTLELQRILDKV